MKSLLGGGSEMCGIMGCFGKGVSSKYIGETLHNLRIRGRDGLGYWGMTEYGKVFSHKGLEYKGLNEILCEFDNVKKCKTFLANSRAIPTTEIQQGAYQSIENQQPFTNERWVVVHNGLISNDYELERRYGIKRISKVDSSLLPGLFDKLGVVDGLKVINGSYAIIAYDRNKNEFWFGTNFMPLFYVKVNKGILVASLKEMFPKKLQDDVHRVEPYTLFKLDGNGKIESFSLWRRERNKKVLVICSSGIDSTTVSYLYKHLGYEVNLIHFRYGQAAEEVELWGVEHIAEDLNANLYVYNAQPIFGEFKNASRLLSLKKSDKELQMLDAESTLSYVPNRNMIFASIAAGVAERDGIDTVAMGLQQMDSVYPDNSPVFVDAINFALKTSLNWYSNVSFRAPLQHLIKHEVVFLGETLGVPWRYVCSCYYPELDEKKGIVHCGECGCCQYRLVAFSMLGIQDDVLWKMRPSISISKVRCLKKVDLLSSVIPYV